MRAGRPELLAAVLIFGGLAWGLVSHDNSALVIGFAGITVIAARVFRFASRR
jgi:hypothetical protein